MADETLAGGAGIRDGRWDGPRAERRARWWTAGAAFLVMGALYWPVIASMAAIWWRSETFAHGFLILPITLFLIWRMRARLAALPARIDYRALAALAALGLVWLLASLADVLVIRQLAFVAMVPALAWLLLGAAVTRALAFPLGFLIFAVPMGEELIPPMMDFTASFTVHALRFTGIPVYWEGTFFTIPSGKWSVVEGCSGVRYLIASVTLGFLYAYLMYRGFWRRAAFVALAVVVPVIANGLRAYMIVMIAHLSDMRLALGVDHFIYGWVFFGAVMFVLFWIGALWREPLAGRAPAEPQAAAATAPGGARRPAAGLLAAVAALGVWPAWALYLQHGDLGRAAVELPAPGARGGWHASAEPFTSWRPRYVHPNAEVQQSYSDGVLRAGVYLAYYTGQRQGAELISSQNLMVIQKHPVWRQVHRDWTAIDLHGATRRVSEFHLASSGQKLLIWQWNWVAGAFTFNDYYAKLREAVAPLLGGERDGAAIVVYTPLEDDPEDERLVLQRYVREMLPAIEASIAAARGD